MTRLALVIVALSSASAFANTRCYVEVNAQEGRYSYAYNSLSEGMVKTCMDTALDEKARNPGAVVHYQYNNGNGFVIEGDVQSTDQ